MDLLQPEFEWGLGAQASVPRKDRTLGDVIGNTGLPSIPTANNNNSRKTQLDLRNQRPNLSQSLVEATKQAASHTANYALSLMAARQVSMMQATSWTGHQVSNCLLQSELLCPPGVTRLVSLDILNWCSETKNVKCSLVVNSHQHQAKVRFTL